MFKKNKKEEQNIFHTQQLPSVELTLIRNTGDFIHEQTTIKSVGFDLREAKELFDHALSKIRIKKTKEE